MVVEVNYRETNPRRLVLQRLMISATQWDVRLKWIPLHIVWNVNAKNDITVTWSTKHCVALFKGTVCLTLLQLTSVKICPKHDVMFNVGYMYLVVFQLIEINPLNPELNPICYLLALLGAHHFLHVSRIRVKLLTFRLLMSYIFIWSTYSWCF